MRKIILSMCLMSCTAVLADAPAPTGLDRLAAILPGTWKTEGQLLDSPVSKAGLQHYVTARDCWREADAYKCVSVVNGTLQLYDIFSWDAIAGVYHQTRITPQGKQPDFSIAVKGDTWTFDQDIARADGSLVHYRVTRTYAAPGSETYANTFSSDGKTWADVANGTETRLDPPK
ncbi:MAG TPA: hypothetical protein VGN70_12755 [Gammaproteobacteria bacterium]|jgi:hypothetical protein